MTGHFSIKLKNDIEQIKILTDKLDEVGNIWNLSKNVCFDLNLSLEELVSNTIFYGFEDSNEHFIEVNLNLENQSIKVEIIDDGIEFNPLLLPEPDLNAPLAERKIGGLGIYFVKKIMENIEYKRINSTNHLTFFKTIS